jgi:hypothetical protein
VKAISRFAPEVDPVLALSPEAVAEAVRRAEVEDAKPNESGVP